MEKPVGLQSTNWQVAHGFFCHGASYMIGNRLGPRLVLKAGPFLGGDKKVLGSEN